MYKLIDPQQKTFQQSRRVTIADSIMVSTPHYSNIEIDELFGISGLEIVRKVKRLKYRSEISALQELSLSYAEAKLLYGDLKLSLDSIKGCISVLKLSVPDISFFCSAGFSYSLLHRLLSIEKLSKYDLCDLLKVVTKDEVCKLVPSDFVSLVKIKGLCCRECKSIREAEKLYDEISSVIPSSIIEDLTKSLAKIQSFVKNKFVTSSHMKSGSLYPNRSYEEILRFYMDLSSGRDVTFLGYLDAAPTVFNVIVKVIRQFGKTLDKVEFFDVCPIKPYVLAAIWLAMICELNLTYFESSSDDVLRDITKSVLSTMLSLLCGVTGYFHLGGEGLPINPTSMIRTAYAAFGDCLSWIENSKPRIYEKIPSLLKFTPDSFKNLKKERQVSTSQGLCMLYTFRVGDSLLSNLLNISLISKDTLKKLFRSLCPIPLKSESLRMYYLYLDIPLYVDFDMENVFVKLPPKN